MLELIFTAKLYQRWREMNQLLRERCTFCLVLFKSFHYWLEINSFQPKVPFPHPLKTSKKRWFSNVFKGCKNKTLFFFSLSYFQKGGNDKAPFANICLVSAFAYAFMHLIICLYVLLFIDLFIGTFMIHGSVYLLICLFIGLLLGE